MSGEFTYSSKKMKGLISYVSEKTGEVKEKELECSVIDDRLVFEGDIVVGSIRAAQENETNEDNLIITSEEHSEEFAASSEIARGCIVYDKRFRNRWDRGIIPFTIQDSLPDQARIRDAIRHWEENTPIIFIEKKEHHRSYVEFVSDPDSCWSFVGRQGGRQRIGLSPLCSTANVIHEIGHAVGLWHEQSREDRDLFVTINWENIEEDAKHNFNQHIADGYDTLAYDYDSIMHYPEWAFSSNGKNTITAPAGVTIGLRTGLSTGDIAAVSFMYGYREMLIGNKRTHELHFWDCKWAKKIAPSNEQWYLISPEWAKSLGYNGCHYCMPDWDTD